MKLRFVTADVFTDVPFGGNPLAVFPDARGIDAAMMQRIAREMSLSETTFVLPAEDPRHTRRVRIFTPASELPFAGHPTVGTACVLAALGEIGDATSIVFEEAAGPVPVSIRREGTRLAATLTAPRVPVYVGTPPPAAALAEMLGLDPAEVLDGDDRPAIVSTAVPFLVVPLRDRAALGRARLGLDRWERLLGGAGVNEVYPVTRDAAPGFDLQVRMFAPAIGIVEDPATGSAASAVVRWLAEREKLDGRTLRWVLSQGTEMGRPSRLDVEADTADGELTAVRVGGATVLMSRGEMDVPQRSFAS